MTQYLPLIIPVVLLVGFLIYIICDTIKTIINCRRLKKENDVQIKKISDSFTAISKIQKECISKLKEIIEIQNRKNEETKK